MAELLNGTLSRGMPTLDFENPWPRLWCWHSFGHSDISVRAKLTNIFAVRTENQAMSEVVGYYRDGETVRGPFSPSDLKRLVSEGRISASTLIRRGKDGKWIEANRVFGLFPKPPETTELQEGDGLPQNAPSVTLAEEYGHSIPLGSGVPASPPIPNTPAWRSHYGDSLGCAVPASPPIPNIPAGTAQMAKQVFNPVDGKAFPPEESGWEVFFLFIGFAISLGALGAFFRIEELSGFLIFLLCVSGAISAFFTRFLVGLFMEIRALLIDIRALLKSRRD